MSAFTDALDHNMAGLTNINPGFASSCPDCRHAYGFDSEAGAESAYEAGLSDEGSFSWHSCECCGTHLGGNRSAMHAFDEAGTLYHLEACDDCVIYFANGDEPDEWEV